MSSFSNNLYTTPQMSIPVTPIIYLHQYSVQALSLKPSLLKLEVGVIETTVTVYAAPSISASLLPVPCSFISFELGKSFVVVDSRPPSIGGGFFERSALPVTELGLKLSLGLDVRELIPLDSSDVATGVSPPPGTPFSFSTGTGSFVEVLERRDIVLRGRGSICVRR